MAFDEICLDLVVIVDEQHELAGGQIERGVACCALTWGVLGAHQQGERGSNGGRSSERFDGGV